MTRHDVRAAGFSRYPARRDHGLAVSGGTASTPWCTEFSGQQVLADRVDSGVAHTLDRDDRLGSDPTCVHIHGRRGTTLECCESAHSWTDHLAGCLQVLDQVDDFSRLMLDVSYELKEYLPDAAVKEPEVPGAGMARFLAIEKTINLPTAGTQIEEHFADCLPNVLEQPCIAKSEIENKVTEAPSICS